MKEQNLKDLQKKLQIITDALQKEKLKSKTCLTTLKEYEKLTREKEDQINDIKNAILDINTQMKIQQNKEAENNKSSKVSNLFGSIFSKKVENSQQLENLEEELKLLKEENMKLNDKYIKLKELNSEQRNKFEGIINSQKISLEDLNVKKETFEKQNESVKEAIDKLKEKINEFENDKKNKEQLITNTKIKEENELLVQQNIDKYQEFEILCSDKTQEIKNLKLKIQNAEKQIIKLDDGISNLSEKFPCDLVLNGNKERINAFFGRNYDNNQFTLTLSSKDKKDNRNDVIEFKDIISCGRNMSNKTQFILNYLDNDNLKQYTLIFNESVSQIFESNYFSILSNVGDSMG
jgi:chromosome segregation ATPase